MTHLRSVKRAAAVTAVAALALSGMAAPTAVAATETITQPGYVNDSSFSAEGLPTTQIDGVATTIQASDTTAYVGGTFRNARPAGAAPGTQLTPRSNMLAFDVATGELLTGFRADTDGEVKDIAISDDGTTVFIAGAFTTVNGQARKGFAALDARTGAVQALDAQVAGNVAAVATHGNFVYLGGTLREVQGLGKWNLTSIDLRTNRVTSLMVNMSGPGSVRALEVSPNGTRIAAGGQFNSVDGVPVRGFALLDSTTGRLLPSEAYTRINTGGTSSAGISDLDGDETGVYLGGFAYGDTTLEGTASLDWNGNIRWVSDCHGDSTAIWSSGDSVHYAGHAYSCATMSGFPEEAQRVYHGVTSLTNETSQTLVETSTNYLSFAGLPAPRLEAHHPRLDIGNLTGQAAWSVGGNDRYMVVGGEFPRVNGQPQQGLTRFARRDAGPSNQGPMWNDLGIDVISRAPGEVQVRVTPTWDRDDAELTYQIIRSRQILDERTIRSSQWASSDYAIVDKLEPGTTATYWVHVRDKDGNLQAKQSVQISSAPGTTTDSGLDSYRKAVAEDAVRWFFEPGATGAQSLSTAWGMGTTTGLMGDAWQLNGGSEAYGTTADQVRGPVVFSTEAWIQVPQRFTSGSIMSFGSARSGSSATRDRLLYLTNDGRLAFGTYPTGVKTQVVQTPQSVNDGQWHHVVATLAGDGTRTIYVDGTAVVQERLPVGAADRTGYWRVGAENLSGWPNAPQTRRAASAVVDAPAVYHAALTAEQVQRHYKLGLDANRPATPEPVEPTPDPTPDPTNPPTDPVDPPTDPVDPVQPDPEPQPGPVVGPMVQDPRVVLGNARVVVRDSFSRTSSNRWNGADLGGTWSSAGAVSVRNGVGVADARYTWNSGGILGIRSRDGLTSTQVRLEALPTVDLTITLSQRIWGTSKYETNAIVSPNGDVRLQLVAVTSGHRAVLNETPALMRVQAGQWMNLSTSAIGGSTTELTGTVWLAGTQEPAFPQVTAIHTGSAITNSGGIAMQVTQARGAQTNVPVSFDNLSVRSAG